MKPTVVLVHGAFADSSSWNGVAERLSGEGHRVVAVAVGLVYVAGFALEPGESCADAAALASGSTLAETLELVPLAAGGADASIAQERYHQQFAADLPDAQAALMAITQRPVTQAALSERSGERPLWQSVPSWFLFGELDRNIPAGAHRIMARRAQSPADGRDRRGLARRRHLARARDRRDHPGSGGRRGTREDLTTSPQDRDPGSTRAG